MCRWCAAELLNRVVFVMPSENRSKIQYQHTYTVYVWRHQLWVRDGAFVRDLSPRPFQQSGACSSRNAEVRRALWQQDAVTVPPKTIGQPFRRIFKLRASCFVTLSLSLWLLYCAGNVSLGHSPTLRTILLEHKDPISGRSGMKDVRISPRTRGTDALFPIMYLGFRRQKPFRL